MTAANARVDGVVRKVLEDTTGTPASAIRPELRLVDDLTAASDDLSFLFVPAVERELNVHVRQELWRSVHTVQDAVDVLQAALAERS
jgi:hypothetical protein